MTLRKYGWIVGLVLLVGMGGIGYWIGTMGDDREAPERLLVPPEPSREEKLRREFESAVVGHDGDPIVIEQSPEGWRIEVELHLDSLNLQSILERAVELFQQLDRVGDPVAYASIQFRTDVLRDVFGRTIEDALLLHVALVRENFERMEWRGFDPVDFPHVAEVFWLHDELQPQWREMQLQDEEGGAPQEEAEGSGQQGGAQSSDSNSS